MNQEATIELFEVPSTPIAGDRIAVWFSCGAASAVALKETVARYPDCQIVACNNFIAEEDSDNRRFLKDVSEWTGVEIIDVRNPLYPSGSCVDVWEDRQFMSGVAGAPCTQELKFKARLKWEQYNYSQWVVMGFHAGESDRHEDLQKSIPTLLPVLIDAGYDKGDCFRLIMEAGIELPRMYRLGYPNANCPGCVKATSPTYWNHVREMHPEVFEQRAEMSRRLGAKLVRVNNERIYLDELDPEAKGRPMKDLEFECNGLCPGDY